MGRGETGRPLTQDELKLAVDEIRINPHLYTYPLDAEVDIEGYEHPRFKGMIAVISIGDDVGWSWVKRPIRGELKWVDAPDMFFMLGEGWSGYGAMTVIEDEHDFRFNSPLKVSWSDEPDEDTAFFGPLNWDYDVDPPHIEPTKWKAGDRVWPIYFHSNSPGGITLRDDNDHQEYWQCG